MAIRIITDSTADFTRAEAEELGLEVSGLSMTEYVILPLLQAGIARLVSEWRRTALP